MQMSAMHLSSQLRAPAALRASHATRLQARPRVLQIRANTFWQLAPDPKKNKAEPALLCESLGSRRICTVAGHNDFQGEDDVVLKEVGQGIHVTFKSEGSSDQPTLVMQDNESETEIKVDGKPVPKNQDIQLRPGSMIQFGDGPVFQIQRDQFAHA